VESLDAETISTFIVFQADVLNYGKSQGKTGPVWNYPFAELE